MAPAGKLPVTTSPPPRKSESSPDSTPVPVALEVSKVANVPPSQSRELTMTSPMAVISFLVMM